MEKQTSLMLENLSIPEKWRPRYYLKRINETTITISRTTRDEILKLMTDGGKYVQIGEYTIMVNTIKAIEPVWGEKHIPPCPPEMLAVSSYMDKETNTYKILEKENPEYHEWMSIFGEQERLMSPEPNLELESGQPF